MEAVTVELQRWLKSPRKRGSSKHGDRCGVLDPRLRGDFGCGDEATPVSDEYDHGLALGCGLTAAFDYSVSWIFLTSAASAGVPANLA